MYVKQENIPMQWARRDWPISCCCNGRHLMASRFDHSSVFFSISVTAVFFFRGVRNQMTEAPKPKKIIVLITSRSAYIHHILIDIPIFGRFLEILAHP